MFCFLLGALHGALIVWPGGNGHTVVHTQMWEVGSTWRWAWAVKEEKGTLASWGRLGERVEPPREGSRVVSWVAAVHSTRGWGGRGMSLAPRRPSAPNHTSHPQRLRLREGKELAVQTPLVGRRV